ncbi:MAG: septum formation protein Maf [Nitrospirae bacterium RIFOXYB2_FULL_43_5]|nr:MAG: septum formation protein Maf [Nitrospirae bacterium RIFOXYA2_FULL_44_9]OGW76216.1 MAG: septum formation protein Maf [Nitrospirae bacterium RIFOXYB2_FULL_43_5]HBG93660.1 septum formation inhibitor Maf [Nitrospiraceae bacterium]HBU06294.1 septum formation inhibitor Maf [Nitrospiraceae bacterium]
MKKIILASASPRRKEILALTGLRFRVEPSDYEEILDNAIKPHNLAKLLSLEKAMAVAGKYRDALIIAADTFIVFKRKFLGKPHTSQEARKMLSLLNGKFHSVITGYTILDTGTGKKITRSVETKVWFKNASAQELDAYVATREPIGKAGAYAIQGRGAVMVKKIEGDYLNVVGLPLFDLVESLRKFGIRLL